MQLYKCPNCFLKAHNKQLNKYCLNFIIFLPKKKKVLNNSLGSDWVAGQVDPQKTRVKLRVNLFLLWVKKSDTGRVGSSQKILTHFAMSSESEG